MARYFGKVCAKHPELKGERSCANRTCLECGRAAWRKWRSADPEGARAAERARYAANLEDERGYLRLRYAANREQAIAYQRAWREANPEKVRIAGQTWRSANPAAVAAAGAVRRARKKNAAVPLTAAEKARYKALYAEAQRLTRETGELHTVDHDRPLARGGLDHPDNMHVIPASINFAKGARYESTWDFISS